MAISEYTEWRDVPEFDGYQASSTGLIRRSTDGVGTWAGRVLGSYVRNAYVTVSIKDAQGAWRNHSVHTLIASAFLGARPEGMCVNHINGNKFDNSIANLEYATPAENNRHANRTGLNPVAGENNPATARSNADVELLRAKYKAGASIDSLMVEFGLSRTGVCRITSGDKWGGDDIRHPRLRDLVLAAVNSAGKPVRSPEVFRVVKDMPRRKKETAVDGRQVVSSLLAKLFQMGAIRRVGVGLYQAHPVKVREVGSVPR